MYSIMKLVVLEEPYMLPGAPQPGVFDLWNNPARPIITLGRHRKNDIIIVDSSVSRRHLELEVRENGLMVRDLDSSNGTFVDNMPLPPQKFFLIQPGSKLQVGNVILLLEGAHESQPPRTGNTNKEQLASIFENSRYAAIAQPAAPDIIPVVQPQRIMITPSPPQPTMAIPAYPAVPPAPTPDNAFLGQINTEAEFPGSESPNPFIVRDHSALNPPKILEKPEILRANGKLKRQRGPRAWVFLLIALIITALITVGVYYLVQFVNNTNTVKVAALPAGVFFSPSNSDSALGIVVAHPSNWQRVNADSARVIFTKPDSSTAAFTIEKPPSRTISNPNLTPEEAVKSYTTTINTSAKNPRTLQAPEATRLKDETPAWVAKVVFSANEDNVSVIDYTVTVLSFQCNGSLYFVSVGEEGRLYTGTIKQNLEAAIANVSCT